MSGVSKLFDTFACVKMEHPKIGILFLHGIVGNNRIFQFLVPRIPPGCETMWLTLAGHGGDASDFSKASMRQWKRQVAAAVDQLASRCDKIVAVAHSMGCLLTLGLAAQGKIDGLLMLNPPLRIRPRMSAVTNALKVGLGITRSDPVAMAALDAYGVAVDYNPLHYYGWPMRYYELFREARRTRKLVESRPIDCIMAAVTSLRDELVFPKSIASFAGQQSCRVECLSAATHYYFPEDDRQRIADVFTGVIAKVLHP